MLLPPTKSTIDQAVVFVFEAKFQLEIKAKPFTAVSQCLGQIQLGARQYSERTYPAHRRLEAGKRSHLRGERRAFSCSTAVSRGGLMLLALATVGSAAGAALQDRLGPFGGNAAGGVGRIALELKLENVLAHIDAAGFVVAAWVDLCQRGADAQAADQKSGEGGSDSAFGQFHGGIS